LQDDGSDNPLTTESKLTEALKHMVKELMV